MKSLIYNKPIHVLLFSFLLSCSYMAAQVRVVDNKGTISTIPIDWTRVLGTTKDIYNTDQGNVGIGTKTPKATFHNAGSTILGAKASAVLSSSTALTDADIADYTVFNYSASASGLALTLPSSMTDVTAGRMVTIANTGATNSFSVSGVLLPAGYAQAFVWNGFGWSSQSSPVALAVPFSGLTAATVDNTLDNTNYAQIWNWSTADTQNPLKMNVPALTTGQALNITGGSALTSGSLINASAAVGATTTKGLLNIANTAASSDGTVATIQANSTPGSGLTVLANGNVGVGISAPEAALHLQAGTAAAGTAPLKLTSGTNLTTAEIGAVEFDGSHFYGTAGTNRLTLDNSALTGTAGGTAQAQTVDNSISALTKGMTVTWVPTASNTAADPTLAVGTATAITVKKSGTASLAANDIALDVVATAVYDGTNWQLQNPQSATAWSLTGNTGTSAATNFMGTTDNVDVIFKRNNIQAGWLSGTFSHSTAFGLNALPRSTVTGTVNTAIGDNSMTSTTSGNDNVGVGFGTLFSNTTGSVNVAVGREALTSNLVGGYNTAVGGYALNASIGINNTAVGTNALKLATSNRNTALGFNAGSNITGGYDNIAIGYNAQVPNASGASQLSIANSIYGLNIGIANPKVGIGVSAPTATLHLQAGTATAGTAPLKLSSGTNLTTAESGAVEFDGSHFYGTAGTNRLTLDNSALTGIAGGAAQAQTVGNSISALTTGMTVTWVPTASNTAADPTLAVGTATAKTVKKSGTASLAANDIALGVAATAVYDGTNWQLQNPQSATAWSLTGNGGTTAATNFIGTTDDVDVVFKRNGILAGLVNNSLKNTSWGVDAFNTTALGGSNSAFGSLALKGNTIGINNTAVGVGALYNNTVGTSNVAVGKNALVYNVGGGLNVAVGEDALKNNTTGVSNTALGYSAGDGITTGSNNIAIGKSAQVPAATADNQLSIGNSIYGLGMGTATPKIGIGNSAPTVALDVTGDVKVSGVLSTPSDMRLKKDIETLTDVLSKIEQLRGVRYEYKDQQKYAVGPQVGVIAQELQKVFPELVRTDPDGFLSVNYSQLTGVLIQAVKEQQQEIDLLKKQMKQVMEKLNIN